MSDTTRILTEYTQGFARVHMLDVRMARVLLISTFVSCYGMMSAEDRFKTVEVLFPMLSDMSGERFEDGQDMVSLLKEKFAERLGDMNDQVD